MKNYIRTNKYDKEWISENWMGPNPLILLEELCENMDLKPGMRVLDMGCGRGLTSVFLAKEYGVTVFANDLWIRASDNLKRFEEAGVSDRVFPIHAEAHALPYAENFFDAAVSIDSYHYYGTDEYYLQGTYSKLVKTGGQFGIAVPGFIKEFENGYPDTLKNFWDPDMFTFHSGEWWRHHWEKTGLVKVTSCYDISGIKEIWRPYALWAETNFELPPSLKEEERKMPDFTDMEFLDADTGNDLALIVMTARKI